MKGAKNSKLDGTIVFDLETKTLIPNVRDETLRNQAIRNLEPSVICVYDFASCRFTFYTQKTIKEFIAILKKAKTIVGYNLLGFDYLVLEKYGLNALSKENIGRGKLLKGKAMVGADPVTLFLRVVKVTF